MEIRITTKQVLTVLTVIAWVIFIGLCIEAGGFIVNIVVSIVNPEAAGRFWQQVDLSDLLKFDSGYFLALTINLTIVMFLKALMFYLIIKMLHHKQFDMTQPFKRETGRFIFNLSYLALCIGLFAWSGIKYSVWLANQGVSIPDTLSRYLGGADVWLFMGVILFVIAQIFKRGIEIQSENELTV